MNLKENQINEINELCKKHHVEKMHLFGSVLTNKFNSKSDIDLLVKFNDFDLKLYFLNYMDLKNKLEKLLERSVDLVEEQTLKNPFLINSINRNKKLIYG